MKRTRRMIGVSVFVTLAVLASGWALEKSYSSYAHGRAAVSEPANASDAVTTPLSREHRDEIPAARGVDQEYDRSDLLLSQG